MPYEVFSPFTRCAEIHGTHFNLEDAASCYSEIVAAREGQMRSWKHTGKHVHVIGAVDRNGNQRAFSGREQMHAKDLNLPPEAILTEKERITTFYNIAKMFYEASRLFPISSVSLEGMFDYEARDKHFWSTEAGMGQAFAYAQQVAFTLEISLKALLEFQGNLLSVPTKTWQTHDLGALFNLLDEKDKQTLEQRWKTLPTSERHTEKTFAAFLKSARNHYTNWRYIPTLKSEQLSMDTIAMLSASRLLLDFADYSFRQNSPIEVTVTSTTSPGGDTCPNGDTRDHSRVPKYVMVEGLVRSVAIPDGFDPFAHVEVVVETEFYLDGMSVIENVREVAARFRKSNVENYYGLEGERVSLVGLSTDAEPYTLDHAHHRDVLKREPSYTFEGRTLRGTVYNMTPSGDDHGRTPKVTLVLSDSTFYSRVDCQFLTEGEREIITNVQLGDEVAIDGQVVMNNGRPIALVGPTKVEQLTADTQ